MRNRYSVLIMAIVAIAIVTTLELPVAAQKRTGRPGRPAKPAPAPPPFDMRPGARQIAEQIGIVSRFIFIYGKVVNGLEVARDQAKRGETSAAIEARNRQTRETLVRSIGGLRTGIESVATAFQAEPQLQIQYLKLGAASDAVGEAEQLAGEGRFDEAGTALSTVIQRLTETIISMKLL